MRRSMVLAAVIAASTAVFGACEPKADAPNKPVNTPTVNSSPASTPAASPSTSPKGNTNSTPEVKKPEAKAPETNGNKEVKPATNVDHK